MRPHLLPFFAVLLSATSLGCQKTEHSDTKPSQGTSTESTASAAASSAPKPNSSSVPSTVAKTVVPSTPPLGAITGPTTPTLARFKARSCAAASPIDVGTSEGAAPKAALSFGATSGLVSWAINDHRLAVRPIDRSGKLTGPMKEMDVVAPVDRTWGLRALANHFVAILSRTDYSGSSPIVHLYARVLGKDGAPVGKELELDIGNRGMIDSVSDAAANGFLIYAGATPATNVRTARQISVYVAPSGEISQSVRDYPDPTPGDRALPHFSFSPEHGVVVLPNHVLVDGELKESKQDPSVDAMTVAPQFTGSKVPLVGYATFRDIEANKKRYGALTLDGKRTFEAKVDTKPLRAPFEETATWNVGSGDADVTVNVMGKGVKLAFPGISSGIFTTVTWSGEQAFVLYTAGPAIRVAPLPCK